MVDVKPKKSASLTDKPLERSPTMPSLHKAFTKIKISLCLNAFKKNETKIKPKYGYLVRWAGPFVNTCLVGC
jgi:hypothetical protein